MSAHFRFAQRIVCTRSLFVVMLLFGLILADLSVSQAQIPETILHTFNSYADGNSPTSPPLQGQDGAHYGTTAQGGTNGRGTIYKFQNGVLTTLHSFTGLDGSDPLAGLIQGKDGTLYGCTQDSWTGWGVVYKIHPDGSGFTVLHNFSGTTDGMYLISNLVLGSDGNLYGAAQQGGANNKGTVFQISTDGSTFNVIHTFSGSDGAYPDGGLIQASDGYLYGTTVSGGVNGDGTIFLVSTDGATFNTLFSFYNSGGYNPYAGVIRGSDGYLYGTTNFGGANGVGTIYRVSPNGAAFSYRVLHDFSYNSGYTTVGGLIQGSDGYLYGAMAEGSANYSGALFQVSTDGTVYNNVYNFSHLTSGSPSSGVIQGSDGRLHGVTAGTLYTLDTAGTTYTTIYLFSNGFVDGASPGPGSLVLGKDGSCYGTTMRGGNYNNGTLYKIDPSSNKLSQLYLFRDSYLDGYNPDSSVTIGAGGVLFGTTFFGGIYGSGTAWQYVPATNMFSVLFSFGDASGGYPASSLLLFGKNLYGVAQYGGLYGSGIAYKIELPTATRPLNYQSLHSFSYSDGASPIGALLLGSDKMLYGTTTSGGSSGCGTVFKINPKNGITTTLHNFDNTDGCQPSAALIQGRDGMLYGTTYYGGPYGNGDYGYGTVFQISTDGAVFNTLHNFNSTDGSYPSGVLIQASNGMLYGATFQGGVNGNGTVFGISADGSVFDSIHSFGISGMDGALPYAGVIEGPDGNLYGTTYYGGIDPNPYGGTDIAGTVYALLTELPIIKGFSPTSGSISAGTAVSVRGVNLANASTIIIGGVSQTIQIKTEKLVKIKLNAATPTGSYSILVTTPNGTATSSKKFTVSP